VIDEWTMDEYVMFELHSGGVFMMMDDDFRFS
jgi:hypothetical protein